MIQQKSFWLIFVENPKTNSLRLPFCSNVSGRREFLSRWSRVAEVEGSNQLRRWKECGALFSKSNNLITQEFYLADIFSSIECSSCLLDDLHLFRWEFRNKVMSYFSKKYLCDSISVLSPCITYIQGSLTTLIQD